jgi:hypothetical protein
MRLRNAQEVLSILVVDNDRKFVEVSDGFCFSIFEISSQDPQVVAQQKQDTRQCSFASGQPARSLRSQSAPHERSISVGMRLRDLKFERGRRRVTRRSCVPIELRAEL